MDDGARAPIDPAVVRRLFERGRLADVDDFVLREASRRMIERLASLRVDAATRVLDAGSGRGADAAALATRFPGAELFHLDLARAPLERIATRTGAGPLRWLRRAARPLAIQADFAALPFAPRSIDVLWSNLALHWTSEPHRVLPEWSRVLRVGGLVTFSAFGPDTLREVVDALASLGPEPHVVPFTDMHDYGDMLVASGFATPVVDAERVTLTYASAADFWADVRALGGNPLPRAAGLARRKRRTDIDRALDATRDATGRYRLTLELVFGHAWKGEPARTRDGDAIVRLQRRG